MWMWATFPTLQRYLLPPPSGSTCPRWLDGWISVYIYKHKHIYRETSYRALFGSEDKGSMYLQVGTMVNPPKNWTSVENMLITWMTMCCSGHTPYHTDIRELQILCYYTCRIPAQAGGKFKSPTRTPHEHLGTAKLLICVQKMMTFSFHWYALCRELTNWLQHDCK
jgi:hypothetical protein